jgi:hypothetical protein
MSFSVTVNLTQAGRVNTPPATLYAAVIVNATAQSQGLTILPAGLVEDVAGTDTGALVLFDQGITETVDSFSPYAANPYMLTELGQIYLGQGSTAAPASNTAVLLVFTSSAGAGTVIAPGFTVSDGTYQYTVAAPGGVTLTGGSSGLIFAQATQAGSWTVPAGTVTQLVTSAPTGITLTVTNPSAGTPGGPAQTEGQYRAQVLQAGLVASTGMTAYLRTLLQAVPGVLPYLVSVRTPNAGQWEVIAGGTGDPYAIALAIKQAIPDISTLVGSTLAVIGITAAANGVVTTNLNHGYSTGQAATITGATPGAYNLTYSSITVLTETTFETNVNTSGFGAYVSGGVCTPNFRNTSVTISEYPDSYTIPIVLPPVQTVTMTITWNTSSLNFVSPTGIAQLAQPAIAAYINALPVGAPINLLELSTTFIAAIASVIPETLLTRLVFSVAINTITTAPGSGEQTIFGDPESYFTTTLPSITVIQG